LKIILLVLLSISNAALSNEGAPCRDTFEIRLAALVKLGNYAENYGLKHGKIPDLFRERNSEFESGIPEELQAYNISLNGMGVSDKTVNSIDYMCDLPSKNNDLLIESCSYIFSTKKTKCGVMKFPRAP